MLSKRLEPHLRGLEQRDELGRRSHGQPYPSADGFRRFAKHVA